MILRYQLNNGNCGQIEGPPDSLAAQLLQMQSMGLAPRVVGGIPSLVMNAMNQRSARPFGQTLAATGASVETAYVPPTMNFGNERERGVQDQWPFTNAWNYGQAKRPAANAAQNVQQVEEPYNVPRMW